MSVSLPVSTPLTPADFLAATLELPPVDRPAYPVPVGTRCALTGVALTSGYRVPDLLSLTTTDLLDTFRAGAYVSEAVARCFRSQNPRTGNLTARSHLIFADRFYAAPLINRVAAQTQGRRYWSELARAVWPARAGQACFALITTDTKKRLWHRARVGPLGPATPVFVHDGDSAVSQVLTVDWAALVACLDQVEASYNAGASKAHIRHSLYAARALLEVWGFARVRRAERDLAAWRPRPEFLVATLIAQREDMPTAVVPGARPTHGKNSAQEQTHGDDIPSPDADPAQLAFF